MANVVVYRTYPFENRDPVLDQVETAIAKENLTKKLNLVAKLTTLSPSTLYNIRSGKTRYPRYATVMAIFGAFGITMKQQRVEKFDLESEVADAKRWNQRRETLKLAKKGKRRTGKSSENRAAL